MKLTEWIDWTRHSINNTKSNSIFSLWEWEKLIWLVCWGGWRPSHIENEINEINWMNNGGWRLNGLLFFFCFVGGLWALQRQWLRPKEQTKKEKQFKFNKSFHNERSGARRLFPSIEWLMKLKKESEESNTSGAPSSSGCAASPTTQNQNFHSPAPARWKLVCVWLVGRLACPAGRISFIGFTNEMKWKQTHSAFIKPISSINQKSLIELMVGWWVCWMYYNSIYR